MNIYPAPLDLHAADIQYLPQHRCPACGAAPAAAPDGAWFQPYQDWYGTALRFWSDHLGYLHFQCACHHAPGFAPGTLRAARLGDAVIPLAFDDGALARTIGLTAVQINTARISQAVAFLARHADPARTAGADALAHTLYAVSAGALSPDQAKREIERWLAQQALVDIDVLTAA